MFPLGASHHCCHTTQLSLVMHVHRSKQHQLHLLHQKLATHLAKLHSISKNSCSCSVTWQQLSRLKLRRPKTSSPLVCLADTLHKLWFSRHYMTEHCQRVLVIQLSVIQLSVIQLSVMQLALVYAIKCLHECMNACSIAAIGCRAEA